MLERRRVLRLGVAVIALAAVLRLLSAGFFTPFFQGLRSPQLVSLLMYLETGRAVRFVPWQMQESTDAAQPEEETQPFFPGQEKPTFTPEQLKDISVQYHCEARPDLQTLLTKELSWDLQQEAPTVLIVHTHATETYTQEEITYSGHYRTLDTKYNMVSMGRELARVLRQGGISVIHDTTLHDYPDYSGAYDVTRATIERYLQKYPSITMVLDLHRDAAQTTSGQLVTSATAGGQKSAQLMMVVGTDGYGNYHPNWQENLSVALKLTALLEQTNPGITRPIDLRLERFNMDLRQGSLLVEVGAAGNTHQEAMIAVNALGQSILQLAQGSNAS